MKKNNLWIILAIIYVFVIGAVVMYRMNKGKTETVVTTPETVTSTPAPTAQLEQMLVEFEDEVTSADTHEVSLRLLDPVTFESAGYTLELTYDPSVLKIAEVAEGDVWEKSVELQKDTNTPGKLIYSVGRQVRAALTGSDVMATVKFQVLDNSVNSTEVNLSQTSISAGEGSSKSIVAEPFLIKLK